MNDIISAVDNLDVSHLADASPDTAMYTVDALDIALEDQIRELVAYREKIKESRSALVRELRHKMVH
jgi:hypothetical protein